MIAAIAWTAAVHPQRGRLQNFGRHGRGRRGLKGFEPDSLTYRSLSEKMDPSVVAENNSLS